MNWVIVLAVLSALASVVSACGAFAIALQGRRSSRAQLVSSLHDEHWSAGFHEDWLTIKAWMQSTERTKALAEFGRWYAWEHESGDPASLGERERWTFDRYVDVNAARRRIKGFYRKTQQLQESGFLDEDDVKDLLCPRHRVDAPLFEAIRDLERQINGFRSASQRRMYQYYYELHEMRDAVDALAPDPDSALLEGGRAADGDR